MGDYVLGQVQSTVRPQCLRDLHIETHTIHTRARNTEKHIRIETTISDVTRSLSRQWQQWQQLTNEPLPDCWSSSHWSQKLRTQPIFVATHLL